MIEATPKEAPPVTSPFASYERHYGGMGNLAPDWRRAEREPMRVASRKPWLPASRDVRVLDFGCGWGHQLLALWAAGYRRLEGVELVPEQARIARQSAGGRCEVFCADGRDFLAARPATYDLVVMNDVIEHIAPAETVPVLRVIHAALRPRGRLVVRTPNMASLLASYSRYIDATHATGFTEISLTQVLEQAGFAGVSYVSDFELNPRLWRPWRPLACLYLWKTLDAVPDPD
jgi:2-polyprenyl-3-methyl-5-hydroxy-6-metoxy-1,4-benzoquinol methylase